MYYWVNFINLICYKVNKTIEFRLLRPTYNFNKIKLWLYIFNAILMYAEDINAPIPRTVRLKSVLTKVYPDSILDYLLTGVQKLKILSTNQYCNGDYIGNDITFEDELFPDDSSF